MTFLRLNLQGMTALTELWLDHALDENFTAIDPGIWNGLESITDLHLEHSRGIAVIPAGAFSTIGGTLQVSGYNQLANPYQ